MIQIKEEKKPKLDFKKIELGGFAMEAAICSPQKQYPYFQGPRLEDLGGKPQIVADMRHACARMQNMVNQYHLLIKRHKNRPK